MRRRDSSRWPGLDQRCAKEVPPSRTTRAPARPQSGPRPAPIRLRRLPMRPRARPILSRSSGAQVGSKNAPLAKPPFSRHFWWIINLDRVDEGTMRRIGYARSSSQGQNLDRQIAALRAERCDVIFREKVSGKSLRNRPELEKAIDELGTGDPLIVAEWDRATRSMLDGVHLIERINTRGALIKVLDKPHLDL